MNPPRTIAIDTAKRVSADVLSAKGWQEFILSIGMLGSALALSSVPCAPAYGDESPDNAGELKEIIVTARLRRESAIDAPVVVRTIDGATLQNEGITSITELEQLVPDIFLHTNFLDDMIIIRGIGTPGNNQGFEQQTGLFVDGVYYGNGHWMNSAYVDVDRAEVLQGPQGVYFGKNTIAGAINITTRNPADSFEAYAKAGYEGIAAERYGEAMASGPITDTLRIRAVLRVSGMDGWVKSKASNETAPGSRDTLGRVTAAYHPTESFDAVLKVQGDDFRDLGPLSVDTLFNCAGPNNTPGPLADGWGAGGSAPCTKSFTSGEPLVSQLGPSYTHISGYNMVLNIHWRSPHGELTAIGGFNHYFLTGQQNFNETALPAPYTNFMEGYNSTENTAVSQELRYLTKLDSPFNFLVGAYYQHSKFRLKASSGLFPPDLQGGALITAGHQNSTTGQTIAQFAEIQWKPIKELELDVGGRYTHETKDTLAQNLPPAPTIFGLPGTDLFPLTPIYAHQRFADLSPQVTLTFKPSSDFMAYVAYKTGYLAGGFNQTSILLYPPPADKLEFKPEKAQGGEVGAKFYVLDRKGQINVAAYYNEYSDLQVNSYDPSTTSFLIANASRAENKGIEVNSSWKLGSAFSLAADVDYNNSKYVADTFQACSYDAIGKPACVVDAAGNAVENVRGRHTNFAPVWTGRLHLDYSGDLGGGNALHAGGGALFTDTYFVTGFYRQPGYATVNVNVGIERGHWTADLIGRNITNNFVCELAAGRTFGVVASETQCQVARGAQARVEVTYRY